MTAFHDLTGCDGRCRARHHQAQATPTSAAIGSAVVVAVPAVPAATVTSFLPSYAHSSPPLRSPVLNLRSSIACVSITVNQIDCLKAGDQVRRGPDMGNRTSGLSHTHENYPKKKRKSKKKEKKNAALFPRHRRHRRCWTPSILLP